MTGRPERRERDRASLAAATSSAARSARARGSALDLDGGAIARAAELMRDAVLAGKKVLLCGNGGSAADAQHIAAELVGRFVARAPAARRRSR